MKLYLYISLITLSFISCKHKKQTAAIVDGKEIEIRDVDKVIDKQLFHLLEGVYILRKATLEDIIREKAIEQEASKQGITSQLLIEKEVTSKITDKLVEQKKTENKGRVADRSDPFRFYDANTAFGLNYLKESLFLTYKKKYGDSLVRLHNVKILLSPPEQVRPRMDLNGIAIHYEGNLGNANTIILIGNSDCDGCRQLKPIVDSLFKMHSKSIKFGFVFYDNLVTLSSIALEGADKQTKFLALENLLYKSPMNPDTLKLLKLASTVHIDTLQLHNFLKKPGNRQVIESNISKLQSRGVYSTPVLIINGYIFNAPFDLQEINQYILNHLY